MAPSWRAPSSPQHRRVRAAAAVRLGSRGADHPPANPGLELRTGWGGSVRRRVIIPSIPQVLRLAEALDHFKPGLGDVAIVLAFTGLRWEEAVAVQIKSAAAARRRCGASRAALWLEAPLARARRTSMRASPFGSGGSSSAARLSGVGRNPSSALRVAARWPAATLD
jgi:hypothetical protein